jgi:mRNA-degrading endonuclease YafQ of YafQ-DinJ toxin-antitoxin module
MKFSRTPQFREDYDSLENSDRKNVDDALPNIAKALAGDVQLFTHFRIKRMQGHKKIWEGHVKGDNLCFTFHYGQTDAKEKVCFFRRVGTHKIYKKP